MAPAFSVLVEESEEGSPWAPCGDQAPAQCVCVCIFVRMIEGLRLEATFHFASFLFFVPLSRLRGENGIVMRRRSKVFHAAAKRINGADVLRAAVKSRRWEITSRAARIHVEKSRQEMFWERGEERSTSWKTSRRFFFRFSVIFNLLSDAVVSYVAGNVSEA